MCKIQSVVCSGYLRKDTGVNILSQHINVYSYIYLYAESIAKKMLDVGREHKMRIENLKKDGYEVIGYVRKSPGK